MCVSLIAQKPPSRLPPDSLQRCIMGQEGTLSNLGRIQSTFNKKRIFFILDLARVDDALNPPYCFQGFNWKQMCLRRSAFMRFFYESRRPPLHLFIRRNTFSRSHFFWFIPLGTSLYWRWSNAGLQNKCASVRDESLMKLPSRQPLRFHIPP